MRAAIAMALAGAGFVFAALAAVWAATALLVRLTAPGARHEGAVRGADASPAAAPASPLAGDSATRARAAAVAVAVALTRPAADSDVQAVVSTPVNLWQAVTRAQRVPQPRRRSR